MSSPLVLALPLIEGETPHGYVSRNARLHQVTPRDFCSDLGMRWAQLCSGHHDQLERLSWLTDASCPELKRWSATKLGNGHYRVGQARATRGVFHKTATVFCPRCASEALQSVGPHGLFKLLEWSVSCLPRCHKHGCALMTLKAGGHSHERYDFVTQVLRHRQAVERAADHAHDLLETDFETYVRHRIWHGEQDDWLKGLDIAHIHRASLTLGAALEGITELSLPSLNLDEGRMLCERGFTALSGGPGSYVVALEELRNKSSSYRPFFSADMRPYYDWLREFYKEPVLSELTALTRSHIFKTYPIPLEKEVLGERPVEELWVSMEEARKRSGLGVVFLKRLLAFLLGVEQKNALKRSEVSIAELKLVRQFWNNHMELGQVADTLALQSEQVKALTQRGVLGAVQITSSLKYWNKKDVQSLLDYVEALPTSIEHNDFMPLKDFSRLNGIAIEKIITEFYNGCFDGVLRRGEGQGLHAIEVGMHKIGARTGRPLSEDLSQQETARYLKTTKSAVRLMREGGLLSAVQQRNPETNFLKLYITQESIQQFETSYITLGQWAAVDKIAPMHLAQRLDRDGVQPIACSAGFVRVYAQAAIER